jgi:hypothetical protein
MEVNEIFRPERTLSDSEVEVEGIFLQYGYTSALREDPKPFESTDLCERMILAQNEDVQRRAQRTGFESTVLARKFLMFRTLDFGELGQSAEAVHVADQFTVSRIRILEGRIIDRQFSGKQETFSLHV